MGITYGDHLIDIGYHDITPEQEREIEAREECARRGLDPDEICADGGVTAWMVVANEAGEPRRYTIETAVSRLRKNLECYDQDAAFELENGGERADLWTEIDVSVDDLRTVLSAINHHDLADEIDPEVGFPSDDLLRRIHLDVETRGRKNQAFAVSVHHRSIVLSAVAHALRKRDCTWDEWLEACGWPRGSGGCECYRPGDCDGSCTHPDPHKMEGRDG
jgi:hypothetical protein